MQNATRELRDTGVYIHNDECTVKIIDYFAINFTGDGRTPCYVEPPMIQGHEFVGEVIKLGQGIITALKVTPEIWRVL